MMKKIFLFFVALFFPVIGFGACTPPSKSGDGYEYSDCALEEQGLSSAVKNFWGAPKIDSNEVLGQNGNTNQFTLYGAWECYSCTDDTTCSLTALRKDSCNAGEAKDDYNILAYVATDLSEHGAEFCLTHFYAASWGWPRFFVYQQLPLGGSDVIDCAWFCEPGWDGDRCETRGVVNVGCDSKQYDKVPNNISKKPASEMVAAKETTDPVIRRTKVLDHRYTGALRKNEGGSDYHPYQQQIVIGATEFMKHGIRARPILLGAAGGHSEWTAGWTGLLEFKRATEVFSKYAEGGTEHVLCAQGYTKNDKCEASSSSCGANIPWCSGWKAQNIIDAGKYSEQKHYSVMSGNCKQLKCRNGMHLLADDGYACSTCQETARSGLCPSSGKCVWCGEGNCINDNHCGCSACGNTLTEDVMKFGPNKTDQCWTMTDSEAFKNCVLGIKPKTDEEEE